MNETQLHNVRKQGDIEKDVKASEKPSEHHARLWLSFIIVCFACSYAILCITLVYFGFQHKTVKNQPILFKQSSSRPDILDRNGRLLAKDIKIYSLYAEPRRIIDPNEAIELLSTVLPHLDWQATYNKLQKKSGFVWIQRGLTPKQKGQIMALGLPGLGFRTEVRRFYPNGPSAAHVLGYVDIDNHGIAGIEKYIDEEGLSDLRAAGLVNAESLKPVQLSIDIRVQAAMREVLKKAMVRYRAIAAGAVMLNIRTGEVIGMSSLPDFDSNHPIDALKNDRLNRITGGAYELGSSIKGLTTAMALDSKKFKLNSVIDASKPLAVGKRTFIHDYFGKNRPLHMWEVFVYSSNIGSAREAMAVGIDKHRDFLKRMGLLDKMHIELPEVARPVEPRNWRSINSMTISFGHGLMTTPMQLAVASGALLNDGVLVAPTFLKRNENQAKAFSKKVVSSQISRDMRYLFKLNASIGSGRHAKVDGYRVGGKTGTAEKVEDGKYVHNKRFNSFVAALPMDDPKYILFVIIDEPKPTEGHRIATAAMNAAPIAKEIIQQTAIFLGIQPDFKKEFAPILTKKDQNFEHIQDMD